MSMEGGMLIMLDEKQVQSVLDGHSKILEEHSEKIQGILIDNAIVKEQLSSIRTQMSDVKEIVTEFRTNYLQTTSSMAGTLSTLVINTNNQNADITKNNNNNKTSIVIKVLGIIGACLAGFLAAKFGLTITL